MFDVAASMDAASCGRLDDWVHSYLDSGPWANPALRDGLRRHRRYWVGPILLPLDRLDRCCGPEPDMEFRVPVDVWQRKVSHIAHRLVDPMSVPPLLIEWRSGKLSIRDGNHRHAGMVQAGWSGGWVVIWCNSSADHETARAVLFSTQQVVPREKRP